MFCKNCGSPIADGEMFCKSCGARVEQQQAQPQQQRPQPQQQAQPQQQRPQPQGQYRPQPGPQQGYRPQPGPQQGGQYRPQPAQPPYMQRPQRPQGPAVGGDKLKIFYIVLCIMHLLQIAFWFVDSVTASVMGFSQSASFAYVCEEGEIGFFTPVFVILFIVAAILAVVPLLNNPTGKRRRMIFSKIVSILSIGMVILMQYAISEAGSYGLGSVGFNFVGWLNILLIIAIFVLTVVISNQSKPADAQPGPGAYGGRPMQ